MGTQVSSWSFGLSAPSSGGMAFCPPSRSITRRTSRIRWSNSPTVALPLCPALCAPIGFEAGPVLIYAIELDAADPVVLEAAEIEVALVLAHRGQRRVRDPGRIPPRFQRLAGLVEFQHAAVIKRRRKPFVGRDLLDHAQPEARLARGEVEGRRANTNQRQPIGSIGGTVDVVGVARQLVDQDLGAALLRTLEPVAKHL